MTDLLKLILVSLASRFKSRANLEAEVLILRQQINILRRRMPKRPNLEIIKRAAVPGGDRARHPVIECSSDREHPQESSYFVGG